MRLSCDPNEILWYAMSSPFRREMKAKALAKVDVSDLASPTVKPDKLPSLMAFMRGL